MKLKVIAFLFLAIILKIFAAPMWAGSSTDDLLASLADGNIEQFDKLLKTGANPNKIYGPKSEQWLMCEATRPGKEAFLELAIQNGADVNLRNTNAPLTKSLVAASFSAPILCAITYHNKQALMTLIRNGAELDILSCRDCKRFDGNSKIGAQPVWNNATPITSATSLNEYEMAYKMIKSRKSLTEDELNKLVFQLENNPIDQKSDENNWRLKVADWLATNGRKTSLWTRDNLDN